MSFQVKIPFRFHLYSQTLCYSIAWSKNRFGREDEFMADKERFFYESQLEQLDSYGMSYTTYGIFLNRDGERVLVQHDVALSQKEAERICQLLNKHKLDMEQAKYVIEDCIVETYLA